MFSFCLPHFLTHLLDSGSSPVLAVPVWFSLSEIWVCKRSWIQTSELLRFHVRPWKAINYSRAGVIVQRMKSMCVDAVKAGIQPSVSLLLQNPLGKLRREKQKWGPPLWLWGWRKEISSWSAKLMQNQARVLFHVGLSPHFLLNALGNRFLSPVTLGLGGDICLQCQFAVCGTHFSSTGSSTRSPFGDPAQALTFVLAQWLHPASVLTPGFLQGLWTSPYHLWSSFRALWLPTVRQTKALDILQFKTYCLALFFSFCFWNKLPKLETGIEQRAVALQLFKKKYETFARKYYFFGIAAWSMVLILIFSM